MCRDYLCSPPLLESLSSLDEVKDPLFPPLFPRFPFFPFRCLFTFFPRSIINKSFFFSELSLLPQFVHVNFCLLFCSLNSFAHSSHSKHLHDVRYILRLIDPAHLWHLKSFIFSETFSALSYIFIYIYIYILP